MLPVRGVVAVTFGTCSVLPRCETIVSDATDFGSASGSIIDGAIFCSLIGTAAPIELSGAVASSMVGGVKVRPRMVESGSDRFGVGEPTDFASTTGVKLNGSISDLTALRESATGTTGAGTDSGFGVIGFTSAFG